MESLLNNIEFAELLVKLYQLESYSSEIYHFDDVDDNSLLTDSISTSAIPGLIGKSAIAKSNKIFFDGKNPCEFFVDSNPNIISFEIFISDSKGNIVYEFINHNSESNLNKFVWNGVSKDKSSMTNGEYTIIVIATDRQNQEIRLDTLIMGCISKMIFTKDGVFFKINNIDVPYDSIIEIYE